MSVVVTGPTIEKIWLKCLQCFKSNIESFSNSSRNVPSCFMDMMFIIDHLSHRDSKSSGTGEIIWKDKYNKNIKKKEKKIPKLDHFASKKLKQDGQLVKSIADMQ
ncbi:hypothetical protein TSAR_012105 [Trichomalopsis sarcophagae]|uniref:Uncharacterized protein n=1 Tax=Trichomalopsis sarcophagae TaxID=543379 RepID=A0A232FGP6_9HYME|nr:hypothetical protein TSAR_012105 [Trichomalopsis sarcophagae]